MPPALIRLLAPLAFTAAVATLSGCGGSSSGGSSPRDGDDPPPPPPVELTPARAVASTNIAIEQKDGGRVWVVNQDNDSVSVLDAANRSRLAEIAVGAAPRTVAIGRDGRIWVANRDSATLSRIDPVSLAVAQTVALPPASQPFAVIASPADGSLWVSLQARGEVVRIDPASGAIDGRVELGPNIRHLAMPATGDRLLVSRFITPPLPGESTRSPQSQVDGVQKGGELIQVDPASLAATATVTLQASRREDTKTQGRGIPNYLGAAAISPDGKEAWLPSKQDNVFRGSGRLRAGTGDAEPALNFENSVRAITSRIDLRGTPAEDRPMRVDHDNASLTSAAVYDPAGIFVITALETARELALIDPVYGREVPMPNGVRLQTGRAPQGLAISADGRLLVVNNFMDRSVGFYDLGALTTFDSPVIRPLGDVPAIGREKLAGDVLRGKQLFYDAADPRLAGDKYMSCASCHNDGDGDGRVWDFTSFDDVTPAEGLRNTISLRGRGRQPRLLHWSANFDEVQDFEGQIRAFAGGTGLIDLSPADFAASPFADPLGAPKKGRSADLDALAAYLGSLDSHAPSPWRNADRSLTAAAETGRTVFQSKGCTACHAGAFFAAEAANPGQLQPRKDIGTTRQPTSGYRLGQPLTGANAGINVPTLRDVWDTAPYLHDGSAATLADAIEAHDPSVLAGGPVSATEREALVEFLKQIGSEDPGF